MQHTKHHGNRSSHQMVIRQGAKADLAAADPAFSALWERHGPSVRRHLSSFGIRPADLDDLMQEVFLVAYKKQERLTSVQMLDPWLREVCRRVASGHRRRAHHRHEIAFSTPPETASDGAAVGLNLEQEQDEDRLHDALGRLDVESRDLVALHELGALPLTDVASLVEADRKTVRKRLSIALRRLTHLLASNDGAPASGVSLVASPHATRPKDGNLRVGVPFQILATHPALTIGLIGAVVIAVWPGPPTVRALEVLDAQLKRAGKICGTSLVYFAVVEDTTHPPALDARQKIVAMIKDHHASNVCIHVTALEGGAAWIARPIMTGLSLLARPPIPIHFFNGAAAAVHWLAERHPKVSRASASAMLAAVDALRNS